MKKPTLVGCLAAGAVVVLGLLGLFVVILLWPEGGTPGPPTTNTASESLAGDAEKIAFLGRYLQYGSPVSAAEFHINYRNNDWAPSDWNIRAVVKVAPAEVARWSHNHPLRGPAALEPCNALLARDARFRTSAAPLFYGTNQCWRAVFATDGVVCLSCTTF